MTAETLGSEEEIKRRDDKDKGEKAEKDKIPLAREGAVSIHAPLTGSDVRQCLNSRKDSIMNSAGQTLL